MAFLLHETYFLKTADCHNLLKHSDHPPVSISCFPAKLHDFWFWLLVNADSSLMFSSWLFWKTERKKCPPKQVFLAFNYYLKQQQHPKQKPPTREMAASAGYLHEYKRLVSITKVTAWGQKLAFELKIDCRCHYAVYILLRVLPKAVQGTGNRQKVQRGTCPKSGFVLHLIIEKARVWPGFSQAVVCAQTLRTDAKAREAEAKWTPWNSAWGTFNITRVTYENEIKACYIFLEEDNSLANFWWWLLKRGVPCWLLFSDIQRRFRFKPCSASPQKSAVWTSGVRRRHTHQ